ncbi:MAG: hypothetical protein K1X91_08555 [Bacteriodetes bacterium]|nr:hypothetical protein [Bacteroidota bacterium]
MKTVIICLLISVHVVSCTHKEENNNSPIEDSKSGKRCYNRAMDFYVMYQQSKSAYELDSALIYTDSTIYYRRNWAQAYYFKHCILILQHKYPDALSILDTARKIEHNDITYFYNKGLLFEKMGIQDWSINCLGKAKELATQDVDKKPNDIEKSTLLMVILLSQRDSIGYEKEYNRISELQPAKTELKLFYKTYEKYLPSIRTQMFLDFMLTLQTVQSNQIK